MQLPFEYSSKGRGNHRGFHLFPFSAEAFAAHCEQDPAGPCPPFSNWNLISAFQTYPKPVQYSRDDNRRQQPLGTGNKDNTTALYYGRSYFQHPCCGFGGFNPWTVAGGPWKQLPLIPEATASISQDEFTNHPSPAIPVI